MNPQTSDTPTWQHYVTVANPEQTHELGVRIGQQLIAGDLIILTGALGAGKTTISRAIGEGIGVRGPITSPTFVLARTHPHLSDGPSLIHVDAYRLLESPAEFDDLDLDFASSVVLVEWGAGVVETGENWLEIVIDRAAGAEFDTQLDETDIDETDFDETNFDVEAEPRVVTFAGFGPRWRDGMRL